MLKIFPPVEVRRPRTETDLMNAGFDADEAIYLLGYELDWGERGYIVEARDEGRAYLSMEEPLRGYELRSAAKAAFPGFGKLLAERIHGYSYHFILALDDAEAPGDGAVAAGRLYTPHPKRVRASLLLGVLKGDEVFVPLRLTTASDKFPVTREARASRIASLLDRALLTPAEMKEVLEKFSRTSIYSDEVEAYLKSRRGILSREVDVAVALFKRYADKYGNNATSFLIAAAFVALAYGDHAAIRKALYAAENPGVIKGRGRSLVFELDPAAIED